MQVHKFLLQEAISNFFFSSQFVYEVQKTKKNLLGKTTKIRTHYTSSKCSRIQLGIFVSVVSKRKTAGWTPAI